jgi:hypothetical protein
LHQVLTTNGFEISVQQAYQNIVRVLDFCSTGILRYFLFYDDGRDLWDIFFSGWGQIWRATNTVK